MTLVEPLPSTDNGKGNWQDYINNWRQKDANWQQERMILRYPTDSARATDYPTPKPGQVTYNDLTKTLEMWRAGTPGAWVRSLMFQYLTSNQDSAAGVTLFHTSAVGKGVTLGPGVGNNGSLSVDAPSTFLGGILTVDSTGISVKTGAKTAKLTTSVTDLVSDTPVTVPSLTSGATTVGALTATSVSAGSATVASINMTGTLTGGVLNGSQGLIGGVSIGFDPTRAVAASGTIFGANGLVSQTAYFYGDGSSAIMRTRTAADGTLGSPYIQVGANINIGPSGSTANFNMYPYLRIHGGKGVPWHRASDDVHVAWLAPVIYGGNQDASQFPDGTIWFT